MARAARSIAPDIFADPFGERAFLPQKKLPLLGANFEFASDSRELLQMVDVAYRGLPRHRLGEASPRLRVRLLTAPATAGRRRAGEPLPLNMFSGAGLLGGMTGSSNFVALSVPQGAAVIGVSPAQLRFPYHTRYELIEFAVFTLAARAQRLIPLHGACVSRKGRAVLLMGASGAGKSTAALHCALQGFDFVSEDAVFVSPESLRTTGVANFLHVRSDALRWVEDPAAARAIRHSPVIRRRSGVRKFEVDLRRGHYKLASTAPTLTSVVFLSAQPAGQGPLLRPVPKSQVAGSMATLQPYARSQPEWMTFARNVAAIDAFELRRGQHPKDTVVALAELL